MKAFEAVVIGAGPAGATAALALARAGLSVAVIEKSEFPRRKVCGEYISAATWPILESLGAASLAGRAGPPVHAVGFFAGEHVVTAPMPKIEGKAGRAVRREILDTSLLELAAQSGASIHQPATVVDCVRDDGGHVVRLENGESLSARVVIAANGSWERSPFVAARAQRKDSDLLGFKAHFSETKLPAGLMPLLLFPGGYGGMVSLDGGKASLSCCVRRDALRAIRERRRGMPAGDALFAHIVETCRGVRDALGCAWQATPWLSAGPIRPGIRPMYEHGVFRAGNAAGEAHPLVAEGISMAIQSAQLLASVLIGAGGLDAACLEEAGRRYAAAWHANFALRLRASSAFAALLVTPGMRGAGIRLLRAVPATLTLGARWSGKARPLSISAGA